MSFTVTRRAMIDTVARPGMAVALDRVRAAIDARYGG
jgi:hypothetical protein